MYTKFFGFTKKPFSLTADPSFLFLSPQHKKGLTLLRYGLASQSGFIVITGETGTGKTILIQHILKYLENCEVGLITHTHETFGDLLTWILDSFEIDHSNKTKAECYQLFVNFVLNKYQKNRRVILIIDEAQNMNAQMLEELRLLSNINTGHDVMLQVVLAGECELANKLSQPKLTSLLQRVSIKYQINPLSFEETKNYIKHRLTLSQGNENIFDEMASAVIFYYSAGIPRIINNICELSLVFAFADDKQIVDASTVIDVIKENNYTETFAVNITKEDDKESIKNYILSGTGIDITAFNENKK
jgi:type II secretory pathway predicted ATPase ExeA